MTNFLRNYSCMSRMFHRLSSTINVWPTANDHSLQLWRFSSYHLILLNFEWCLPCKTGMWILFASFILVLYWFIFNVRALIRATHNCNVKKIYHKRCDHNVYILVLDLESCLFSQGSLWIWIIKSCSKEHMSLVSCILYKF